MIPTEYYIFLGTGLFTIGVIGVLDPAQHADYPDVD